MTAMPNYLHNKSVTHTYPVVGLQTTAVRIDLSTNIYRSQSNIPASHIEITLSFVDKPRLQSLIITQRKRPTLIRLL